MLLSTLATIIAGALTCVQAAPAPRASANKIIGYHESWYWYDNGNQPMQFTPELTSKYTHINYAFATIHYHTATKQFYVGFTDAWADYQSSPGISAPAECFKVPVSQQCTGGGVSLVPYIGANGTCPDKGCYNPSGAPGAPRKPQCEAVLDSQGLQYDWTTTPPSPYICGHYAYVMNKVKKANPGLKFLISIGGWYDSNLFSAATEPQYIDKFVTSIVEFVKFFGFDGVDFDWEYPGWEHGGSPPFAGGAAGTGDAEAMTDCSKKTCGYPARTNDMAKFNAMVTKVRTEFKKLGKNSSGRDYLISMAAPAGYDKMNKLDIKTICQQLDFINIMTYDIHGPWDPVTNHQAALYDNTPAEFQDKSIPATSVDYAVSYWIDNGCPANQIVVGVPFYGHAWEAPKGNSNGLYQPGKAAPEAVTAKKNFKDITASAAVTYWDDKAQASYAYDAAKSVFWSYDSPQAISTKVGYAAQRGLGGFMVWPVAGDDSKGTLLKALTGPGITPPPPPSSSQTAASKSTTTTTTATTAAPTTTTTTTTTKAPTTTTTAAPTTTTTTTTTAAPTTTTTTTTTTANPTTTAASTTTLASDCYPAWSAATAPYIQNAKVSYAGSNYVAKWWSGPTDLPGKADSWNLVGTCGSGQTTTTTTTTTKVVPTTTTTTTTTSSVPTTTTTTTTSSVPTTTASGSLVGQPCTQSSSICSAGTKYYCQVNTWIIWYVGC
ncbi:glycosyl hydrolases family 18-domain-containing protein [Obelidium mucronatum]|nr:glycosyl hydrolases family 18-domain-containing protein [Obelidium mucronatum]